jgi:hypothetical protein
VKSLKGFSKEKQVWVKSQSIQERETRVAKSLKAFSKGKQVCVRSLKAFSKEKQV